jgi:hypothetical protein
MVHLHCQDCGAHFTKRAELDGHKCRPGEDCTQSDAGGPHGASGQRGELAGDAAAGVQERPAGDPSAQANTSSAGRRGREFTRSHRE